MSKHLILAVIFALSLSGFSQTQAAMNKMAYATFEEVDDELNEVYQAILKEYKQDTLFIKNLRTAQRVWVQFRDAELEMKYPAYAGNHYGSLHPVCRAGYLQRLTEQRLKTLNVWLQGLEEGEGCAGSVKLN